ncbi:MAG: hypothetical protein HY908_32385 [Myxococcales bacterium]|nr:hypothetical protein [Myxococcales bacterium]
MGRAAWARSSFVAVALALAACAEATGGGIAFPVGTDPLAQPKNKKAAAPAQAKGAAPKERELAWVLPGPDTQPSGAVRFTYLTDVPGGTERVEHVELRRFVRGKWTELVYDVTVHADAEPERRRLVGVGDVAYELGDATCKAWRTERAAEQVAARVPGAAVGLRPYASAWVAERTGPLAPFAGPFRARLIAENEVVEGHRADRYGVSLGAADGEVSGTADVWVERTRGTIVAARGEVLGPEAATAGDEVGSGAVASFAAVALDEDVPDELELADDCRRATVLP